MGFFDDILSQHVTDEADRAVILKYPELKSTLETKLALEARNQAWLEKNYDFNENKTVREKELETALTTANESLAAVAARGNADMTFEEIDAQLKAKGYVSGPDVDAKLAAARGEVTQMLSRQDMGAFRLAGEAANLAHKYRSEFGEDLDVPSFTGVVARSNLDGTKPDLGLGSVYDNFVASKRAEKQTRELEALKTTHAAELAAATARTAEETRRATLMEVEANGGRGMPVDQGRGSAQMGWLQAKSLEKAKLVDADGNPQLTSGRLGDGSATAGILAKMARDKAAGVKVEFVQ